MKNIKIFKMETRLPKLLIPCFAAFVASFCIMVLELIAGRIVARYLGASLYTWASVIGVVLLGIALGSFFGGYLADRFNPRKVISYCFVAASLSCLFLPALNKLIGDFYWLWLFAWPLRIAIHVITVFIIPSLILGIIVPVIVKMALDYGLKTGKTVGSVYAFSAAGSIAGTFITGFFLISYIGTLSTIWLISIVLAVMSLVFSPRLVLNFCWLLMILGLALLFNFTSNKSVINIAARFGLRNKIDSSVLYRSESFYSDIAVKAFDRMPNVRKLIIDQLLHSVIDVNNPTDIAAEYQYDYIKLNAAIIQDLIEKHKFSQFLFLGGGGYILPRYVEQFWPDNKIDVVEIDPAVTQTAFRFLGLPKNSSIAIHHMDARNYIDLLLRNHYQFTDVKKLDIIFCDAISGLSVPYQLTTVEFNGKLQKLLSPRGVYILNVIDNFNPGRLLGSIINTLEKTFSNVYVFSTERTATTDYARSIFTIVGSMQPIELNGSSMKEFIGLQLTELQIKALEARAKGVVLTDDYAPVDNLLEEVINRYAREGASAKLTDLGNESAKEGKIYKAIEYYRKALNILSEFHIAHNNLGNILAKQNRTEEALRHFEESIRIAPRFAEAHSNIATILTQLGRFGEALEHYHEALRLRPDSAETRYNFATALVSQGRFEEAEQEYRRALSIHPDLAELNNSLANLLLSQGKIEEALRYYKEALRINPNNSKAHNNVGAILASQGKIEEATDHYKEALRIDPGYEKASHNLNTLLVQRAELTNNIGKQEQ